MGSSTLVPWDLEGQPPSMLALQYRDAEAFVAWLRSVDLAVPDCWYYHRWVVHRLVILKEWKNEVYGTNRPPKDAAEWWASMLGVAGLQQDWRELARHGNGHVGPDGSIEPLPPIENVIEAFADDMRQAR